VLRAGRATVEDVVAVEEQLTFAHMPPRLFACTPSRLATFDCPRRYRFTYIDRPAPARGHPWAHHVLGATAHVALYRWWLLPAARRTPDEGVRLVRRHWRNLGFRDDEQSDGACAGTAAWVRRYLTHRVDPRAEPVGVDYKTGRRTPTEDDARSSRALALYVLGVRRALRRDCTRGRAAPPAHRHDRRGRTRRRLARGASASSRAHGRGDRGGHGCDRHSRRPRRGRHRVPRAARFALQLVRLPPTLRAWSGGGAPA
jgi:hypothetical protein